MLWCSAAFWSVGHSIWTDSGTKISNE